MHIKSEQFVIFKQELVDGQAVMTTGGESVIGDCGRELLCFVCLLLQQF